MKRWLSNNKQHRLLFQRTWVQFPAPTWHLTTVCNFSSGNLAHSHTQSCRQNTNICKIKIIKKWLTLAVVAQDCNPSSYSKCVGGGGQELESAEALNSEEKIKMGNFTLCIFHHIYLIKTERFSGKNPSISLF
jgi:hypothetical protein